MAHVDLRNGPPGLRKALAGLMTVRARLARPTSSETVRHDICVFESYHYTLKNHAPETGSWLFWMRLSSLRTSHSPRCPLIQTLKGGLACYSSQYLPTLQIEVRAPLKEAKCPPSQSA